MKSDMEGDMVHMKIEGKIVDILTKLNPKLYCKYIKVEKVIPVLYVELKKDLFGTLQAALFCGEI